MVVDNHLDTFNSHQLSEFLKREGIYRHGLWRREEPDCAVCSEAVPYGDLMVQPDPYVLPIERLDNVNKVLPHSKFFSSTLFEIDYCHTQRYIQCCLLQF